MCMNAIDLHNSLSLSVGKIETLARLCPIGATERETLMAALTLLDMVGDYADVLRAALDDLRAKGDAP
jgi:hypothetical protein